MTRPSARSVPPEFTERTSSGIRTRDPYAHPPQERIVLLGTRLAAASADDVAAQFRYLERRVPSAREAVEYGLADRVVPRREDTLVPPTGR